MIKKLFNQKKSTNKRGSMLTLVLVILAMALILITSAVQITNATRSRTIDYTLSNQARTTCTAVAETMLTAIKTQEILDEEVTTMAANGTSTTVTGLDIPGIKTGTTTTVTFGKEGEYVRMDVSTTIGATAKGAPVTENVAVYLKFKEPKKSVNLFKHMMEIGNNCSLDGFNVGMGGIGKDNNTIFIHGKSELTDQSGSTIDSMIIAKDRIKLGNGGKTQDILFAGANAGFYANGGNVTFKDMFFINPSNTTIGKVGQGLTYIDAHADNVVVHNYDVNIKIGQNFGDVADWAKSNSGTYAVSTGDAGYNSNVDNAITANTNGALQAKTADMIVKATSALDPKNDFPDEATASANFFGDPTDPDGKVDLSSLTDYGVLSAAGDSVPLSIPSGIYTLPSTVNAKIECDCATGPYVFYVDGITTISTGRILFKNADPNDPNGINWGRIILKSGSTLIVGDASRNQADFCGIVTDGIHSAGGGEATSGTKPTCFIYGYAGTKLKTGGSENYIDAYCGLYGAGSTIENHGHNFLYGRFSAMEFDSDNSNNTNFPYCPDPTETTAPKKPVPKTSNYEIVRFRYFY